MTGISNEVAGPAAPRRVIAAFTLAATAMLVASSLPAMVSPVVEGRALVIAVVVLTVGPVGGMLLGVVTSTMASQESPVWALAANGIMAAVLAALGLAVGLATRRVPHHDPAEFRPHRRVRRGGVGAPRV